MRTVVILNTHKDADISTIINNLGKLEDTKIVTYVSEHSDKECTDIHVQEELIPSDIKDHPSKLRNFILKSMFDSGVKGFLHIIEDTIEIYNDPENFVNSIEEMITKLKLNTWLNTVTDPCNYTFKIYNPRFSIAIDSKEFKEKYNKTIYLTSHANPSWMIYNMDSSEYDEVKFDDNFKIPMFYIIKFLADRRKNHKPGELSYMNLYPTIMEERDVFRNRGVKEEEKTEKEQELYNIEYRKEEEMFKKLNVDHSPTIGIEQAMEDIIKVLS